MIVSKLFDPKIRKTVHYSLILCILLIQIAIAGFIYTEFDSRKNLTFLQNQLKDVQSLEHLTDNSRDELFISQEYFQKYLSTSDEKYLESYFNTVNKLSKSLDSINSFKFKNPELNKILIVQRKDASGLKQIKYLIDSTQNYTQNTTKSQPKQLPKIKKYHFDYDLDQYDIKTETYKDTIQKKGLFGRLKDAITGTENVRKDSTVITMKQNKAKAASKMKSDLDSLVNSVDKYYTKQVNKVEVTIQNNQKQDNLNNLNKNNSDNFHKASVSLLLYTNNLMNLYEFGIKTAKSDLEEEHNKQTSINNTIRMYLAIGLIVLMFIVSILIMYFTRMAFIYEKNQDEANAQIKENLNFKNRILGMLSHELRSPLKIIDIFINRINKKTTDNTIKDYLKSISFTNNTLLIQANQILEYTKNQQIENKLIPVTFNLKNEIESILKSIEPYIETRNNQLIIIDNIDPNITVFSDNNKINQVFMNIIGNANKFTENGKISVTTTTETIDTSTISLNTTITDTGVGISESDLEKIFEPYYQGVLSDKIENLGAGLGLSLCKEIVELYAGKISVTSKTNKGTTVTFSIKLNLKN